MGGFNNIRTKDEKSKESLVKYRVKGWLFFSECWGFGDLAQSMK
jgi:hypothetical protein